MTGEVVYMTQRAMDEQGISLTFLAQLGIDRRQKRSKCPGCKRRRVLYAVVLTSGGTGGSGWKCAECWGVR